MTKLTIAFLLASTASTLAADLAPKAPAPRAAPDSNVGFYVGFHGGYGWAQASPDLEIDPFASPKPRGTLFGGHAGILWQRGVWAGGLEVDYSAAQLKETQTFSEAGEGASVHLDLSTKVEALASVRARFGILIGKDLYAYGTGGYGWAQSSANVTAKFCAGVACETISASAVADGGGWVAGAGLEYNLTKHLRARVEYLHYDFGSRHYAFTSNVAPFDIGAKATLRVDAVRGGLTFNF